MTRTLMVMAGGTGGHVFGSAENMPSAQNKGTCHD